MHKKGITDSLRGSGSIREFSESPPKNGEEFIRETKEEHHSRQNTRG